MRQNLIRLGVSLGALFAVGCSNTYVTSFSDHATNPTTVLQAMHTWNYWVVRGAEHQFYMCRDTGNTLVCKKECGGDKVDLACPGLDLTFSSGTSNVR